MNSLSENHSRFNKFEKRRKNTKAISIFIIIGGILLLILIGILVFGGRGDKDSKQNNANSDLIIEETEQEDDQNSNNEDNESDKESKKEKDDESSIEKESAEPSDGNVDEAYTANWEPIGTEQHGEHTTQFKKETQDWKEMEHAASIATELNVEDMTTWRIENGGEPQKTIATVSDSDETKVYRVYLSWIDGEGWQPTKVEVLKSNDKK